MQFPACPVPPSAGENDLLGGALWHHKSLPAHCISLTVFICRIVVTQPSELAPGEQIKSIKARKLRIQSLQVLASFPLVIAGLVQAGSSVLNLAALHSSWPHPRLLESSRTLRTCLSMGRWGRLTLACRELSVPKRVA